MASAEANLVTNAIHEVALPLEGLTRVKHTVIEPTQVWLAQTPEGANAALEIDSADETKTVLRFRSAFLPEFVDGVVLE